MLTLVTFNRSSAVEGGGAGGDMIEPLWETGALFAGKYRIEGVLGRGGMGIVLAACHARLDEPLAIKVLLPAMMDTPGVVDRFLREAKAASKIKSEHVVRVIDVDTLPSGVPFIVMERLEGEDLAMVCKHRGVIEIEEAVRWIVQACDAVAHAHARGIVHRDLKPGNLFLAQRPDGSSALKVLDFGISKVTSDNGEYAVTEAGVALGSPSYMSPEQMRSARDVDARTDLWALGAVLFRLLTGRPPFRADSLEALYGVVMHTELPRPSELRAEIPRELGEVITRCLAKDRDRRWESAVELARALLPFAGEGARMPMVAHRPPAPSLDGGNGPSSQSFGPSSGPRSTEQALACARDATTTPEARASLETSDSAPLVTSSVRARDVGPGERTLAAALWKKRRAALATGFLVGALVMVALGLRIRFDHGGSEAIAGTAGPASPPAPVTAAAPIAAAAPLPEPRADAGAIEPVVVPAATVAPSTTPPRSRLPLRVPTEKRGSPASVPSRDPFGGARK